ncbi:Zinc finger, CCHC-type [Lasallia pustulata]|uniref:Zinc finger, CCHC-type n=1 Tax=Lasallia pustulata TaxID=136370 RepID=A0A1W5DDL6_9LECA|nr:Zinc finger, CCHC-type [Lasallia pustulata]
MEQSQIVYAIGRTEGKAQAQLLPFVQTDGIVDFATLNDLIKYMQVAFGNPDKRGTAQSKLDIHTQKNQSFSEYYAEFRCLATIAKLLVESQYHMLLKGVNDKLRSYLRNNDPAEDLEEVAMQLQKADTQSIKWAPLRQNCSQNHIPRPAQPTFNNTTKSTVSTYSATPSTAATTSVGGDAMDLSHQRFQLPEAEKLHRAQENLCFYCGASGHRSLYCPAKLTATRLRELVVPSDSISNIPSRASSPPILTSVSANSATSQNGYPSSKVAGGESQIQNH